MGSRPRYCPEPSPFESAWERGLRHAKDVRNGVITHKHTTGDSRARPTTGDGSARPTTDDGSARPTTGDGSASTGH